MTEELRHIDINKLIPYARNCRTHSRAQVKQIQSSIREFGFVNPVIIDNNYNIIAGHARIMAAKAEGMDKVPCVFVGHLTESQKKAYILADNKLALNADWDMEMLKIEMEGLKDLAFNIELTGFEMVELKDILEYDTIDNMEEDVFDAKGAREEIKTPISTGGDIWLLGPHRLICGDSTKKDTFNCLMEGRKANLIVTDPPYNVNYEGMAGTIRNDNMGSETFYSFLLDAFFNMNLFLSDEGSIYIFHSDTEGLNFRRAFADAGFYLSGTCIWRKQSLVLGRSPYQWQHEPVLFGWKKKGRHQWYADRKQTTIWEFDRPGRNAHHPTMKPVSLIAYPIINSSKIQDLVLDPFGGSGSTLIACEQTKRKCFMIELDEKYCDVIVKRYIEQIGNTEDVFLLRKGEKIAYRDIPEA